jgi:hypothetical protein
MLYEIIEIDREVGDLIVRGKRLGLLIPKIHHKDGGIIIIND